MCLGSTGRSLVESIECACADSVCSASRPPAHQPNSACSFCDRVWTIVHALLCATLTQIVEQLPTSAFQRAHARSRDPAPPPRSAVSPATVSAYYRRALRPGPLCARTVLPYSNHSLFTAHCRNPPHPPTVPLPLVRTLPASPRRCPRARPCRRPSDPLRYLRIPTPIAAPPDPNNHRLTSAQHTVLPRASAPHPPPSPHPPSSPRQPSPRWRSTLRTVSGRQCAAVHRFGAVYSIGILCCLG